MGRIRAVQIEAVSQRLSRPYRIATRLVEAVDHYLVEIESDTGLIGRGCAAPAAGVTGERTQDTAAALARADEILRGRRAQTPLASIAAFAPTAQGAPAAQAAIDVALFDLAAQQAGCPLVDWFGRVHERLETSITIGISPVAETLADAAEYYGRGFRCFKVKVGLSAEEDHERIRKLRELYPPTEVRLRIDANQGYDLADLRRWLEELADFAVEFVEQPLPPASFGDLAQLDAGQRAFIAADESLILPADALGLLTPQRLCGIFNIKLMKCGGIEPARRIANTAEAAGVDLMWGCMDESVVSIAGALHAALSCPATRYLDLDGHLDLAEDIYVGGVALEGGMMATLDGAGLAVERK